MKLTVKRRLAMISAMGFLLSASAPVFSADALPDPVRFTVSMELGDVGQAESWLDAGLPPDFMGSRIGSGLMIGAWEGKPDLMRLFLSRGADINKLNSNGESAIALAAWRGNLDTVKWLLERGARINAPARQWSALHYAVFAGRSDVADFLIDQGADINALSTNGSSVLMMAVYEGHQGLARKLIEKGADRMPKNDWGDGALEWAMRHDRLELARMVTNPEEFNIAVSQPKEKWGAPVRSMRSSKELEDLLNMREKLVERNMSTDVIDKRIATERVRIVRAEMDRPMPARAVAMEITASRKKPQEQSATIVTDQKGKAVGFKAPPATYFGTPKMPIKAPVRNY
ncbi:MAG: ankyrin [Rhodocyclaceae bacterium]|nr:MAG: ankyrin [Rhodocyclaceae bacterium]